jgi:putative hemolysin
LNPAKLMINSLLLTFALVLFIILAGLFAGAETGIYQLSRLRLRLGIEKKQLLFVILGKTLHDSPALLLSMLIGTNLAHYLATSIVTLLLLSHIQAEHTTEISATILTAPVLFVFSELIPKSIFFYRADIIMPYVAPLLFISHKLFSWCGAVPLLRIVSHIISRATRSTALSTAAVTAMRQPHIKAIFQETREEGILSPVQTDIINRLISISNVSVSSAMTPINKVQMVDVDSDKQALLDKLKDSSFTRLPVYAHQPENIIGFVNIYEALCLTEQFADLHQFIKPIRNLAADTIVSDAINIMQTENQEIVLVTRAAYLGQEKPAGIVTMKDLVEELLGELTEW